jgi:hypothetical protein
MPARDILRAGVRKTLGNSLLTLDMQRAYVFAHFSAAVAYTTEITSASVWPKLEVTMRALPQFYLVSVPRRNGIGVFAVHIVRNFDILGI